MEEIKHNCYKGTRILLGNEKGDAIAKMKYRLLKRGFTEIFIPIIHPYDTFAGKVGKENNNQMFRLSDNGNRMLCLAPEYTSVVQQLAKSRFKHDKDVKLFYVAECFRGEKPQAGRYRQFTQLGVEVLNPINEEKAYAGVIDLAKQLLTDLDVGSYVTTYKTTRGLDYYKEGKGFEISKPKYGSAAQIVGGGPYEGGVGFAIGLDRILSLERKDSKIINL